MSDINKPLLPRTMCPKDLDHRLIQLIQYLELDEKDVSFLPHVKDTSFEAELNSCHLNAWVKRRLSGGHVQFGWMLAEFKAFKFVEAIFHSVWRSPNGELVDLTPREDGEKRIMFIKDNSRQVELTHMQNKPAMVSYDGVKMMNGDILAPISRIKFVVNSEMLMKYGLIKCS